MRKDRPPFRRLLIANRGEIAVRIVRACRELGVESVAVFSDHDVDAPHVRAADLAVRLGPTPASESYLKTDAILSAASGAGADALHPGYGFLSERAEFASACEAAGIVFVGPTPETLAGLGDKLAARRSARAAAVPLVPGTFEPLPVGQRDAAEEIEQAAEALGWPLMVKASAGGGGRGMRRVDQPHDLLDAVTAAAREAEKAFGDGSVYLERLVQGGRHIEVQLLGDVEGNVVALGERDCSIQRRHQKLVEEAPAPGLSEDQRRVLFDHAVRVARTVGVRNAATAEFLLTDTGEFFFLEVNARLQVEHGVTELVTGLDLVHEQLWIAAGEPLGVEVRDAVAAAIRPARHAMEVRISAEDPAHDFSPMPGTLSAWIEPSGPGVRVDSGVRAGTIVSGAYDPLLAKLLVSATDRRSAIARLRRSLAEFQVSGIQTTLPFFRWLVEESDFADGRVTTDYVGHLWDPARIHAQAAEHAARAVAAAWAVDANGPTTPGATGRFDPDGQHDSWAAAGRREATKRWQ